MELQDFYKLVARFFGRLSILNMGSFEFLRVLGDVAGSHGIRRPCGSFRQLTSEVRMGFGVSGLSGVMLWWSCLSGPTAQT